VAGASGGSVLEVGDLALACCLWFLLQSCRFPFDMVSQSAGQFGFRSLLGRGSSALIFVLSKLRKSGNKNMENRSFSWEMAALGDLRSYGSDIKR